VYIVWIRYVLQVVATNTDFVDTPRSGTATIRVVLRDVNDNAPIIVSAPTTVTLREDVSVNTIVGSIVATDADSGAFGTVLFAIREANVPFGLTDPTSGQIVVTRPLDFEQVQSYQVTVRAFDNATSAQLFTDVVINVSVVDVNDNAPVFIPTSGNYTCTLIELGPIGEECVNLQATDADGTAQFSSVTFRLLGSRGFFGLNGTRVVTTAPLDRERGGSLSLVVVATDGGGLSTVGTINVTVSDFNNFAPQFSQQVYAASVREDVDGVEVIQVNATDRDVVNSGNSRIAFTIVDGNQDGHFQVDPATGRLTTVSARPLDRENVAAYDIIIKAQDFGHPLQRATNATVRITVTDFNDNRPILDATQLSCSLPEDVRQRTVCTRVRATDLDLNNSSRIEYRILSGNEAGKFLIDTNTGYLLPLFMRNPFSTRCHSPTHPLTHPPTHPHPHAHIYTHTHTQTYTHTHIHTHSPSPSWQQVHPHRPNT
jgi:hypothetical protein